MKEENRKKESNGKGNRRNNRRLKGQRRVIRKKRQTNERGRGCEEREERKVKERKRVL